MHAPVKGPPKPAIQDNVAPGGHRHAVKRLLGVAHRAQHGRQGVVAKDGGQTNGAHLQVGRGLVQSGCAEGKKDGPTEQEDHHQHHQPRHSHKAFLKYIQHYKRSDPAIPCHQAEHHSALCQLVRHRVQQNAQLRNLVETPRDFTIEQVCEAGYPQYHSRPKKLGGRFRFEVQIHKQRDQQNAEIAEDVRDSEHLPQGRFFHVGCSFTRDCFQCTGRGCIYKLRAYAIFFFMV